MNKKLMSKAFTLAEMIVMLVVLGIIAAITIPAVIKRQIESSNRTKIKKAMNVYDFLINKIVIENQLKSTRALNQYGQGCVNTSVYFKVKEFSKNNNGDNNLCRFKTNDDIWWDISNIDSPIIALKEKDLDDENNSTTFNPIAEFDDNGSLRINEMKLYAEETPNYKRIKKMYDYIAGKKIPESKYKICKECTIRYLKPTTSTSYLYPIIYEDSYKEDKLIYTRACSGIRCETEYFNSNGSTDYKEICTNGTCYTSQKYTYNGDKIKEIQTCNTSGTCYTSQKYTYNGDLLTKVETCSSATSCRVLNDGYVYNGDELISYKYHDQRTTYYVMGYNTSKDAAGNTVKIETKNDGNTGRLYNTDEITYDGDSDNILKQITVDNIGYGKRTETTNTYENGKLKSSYICQTSNLNSIFGSSTSCKNETYSYNNKEETKTTTNSSGTVTSTTKTYYGDHNNIEKYCISCTSGRVSCTTVNGKSVCEDPCKDGFQCTSIDN